VVAVSLVVAPEVATEEELTGESLGAVGCTEGEIAAGMRADATVATVMAEVARAVAARAAVVTVEVEPGETREVVTLAAGPVVGKAVVDRAVEAGVAAVKVAAVLAEVGPAVLKAVVSRAAAVSEAAAMEAAVMAEVAAADLKVVAMTAVA
jgi:hypothetical protein